MTDPLFVLFDICEAEVEALKVDGAGAAAPVDVDGMERLLDVPPSFARRLRRI